MLKLPNVTLVSVDTVCHELTRLAVKDSMENIEFAEVIAFSNKVMLLPNVRTINCNVSNNYEAEEFVWYNIHPHIKTSHFLVCQWDGWVLNSEMWTDDFLNYDYIGAPWWYTDGLNVGNGGFSLRSTRFMKFLDDNREKYPFKIPEDEILCRTYRPELEKEGFIWAPESVADKFAFETHQTSPDICPFGFHGAQSWAWILSFEELGKRMSHFNEYLSKRQSFLHMLLNLLKRYYLPNLNIRDTASKK